MNDEHKTMLKCPGCGEMFTGAFSRYMKEKSAQCPTCGVSIPVQPNKNAVPTPPPMPVSAQFVNQMPPSVANPAVRRMTCGKAIAGLVLGITSIVPGIAFGGILLGILGIIFSSKAMKQIKLRPEELDGEGMAIAGLTTAIVGLVISTLIVLLWVFWGAVLLTLVGAVSKAMPLPPPR